MTGIKKSFELNGLKLKNRLVLPPLTTNYGTSKGHVTQDILDFYDKRSKDLGLVIVEATAVQKSGRIVPCSLGLWEDMQVKEMAKLVKTIKDNGAMTVIQLSHSGPKCVPLEDDKYGFAPSNVAFKSDVDPVEINPNEIEQLIMDFEAAAQRAFDAGFDAVEIHGAHLYLLSQFISPLTNKRSDVYGNGVAGRAKLPCDIVKRIKARLGEAYPIFFRINAVEKIDGGLSLEDSLKTGELLVEAGVDCFDVSLIATGGFQRQNDINILGGSSALPKNDPKGANIALAKTFKEKLGKPVIAVGKLWDRQVLNQAIENDGIDMVAIGRLMICDPDSAKKILDNQDEIIIQCDECLNCFATIGKGAPMGCKVNENLPN